MHYEIGYGIKVMINGRKVLVGSYRFMMIEAIEIPDTIYPVIEHCQNMGISLVFVAEDGEMAGLLEMDACLRPEAKEMVNWLKLSGIELFIVSGDQDAPTRKLSDELGMDGYFANVLPDGKANIVNKLKASGKKVGFIGDGINDAIALRAADVSVSFRSATHAASDNAQIVLMNDNLEQLRLLFNLAKTFNKSVSLNYRQSIIMSLSAACAAIFLPHKFLVVQTFFVIELIIGSIIATRPLLDEKTQSGEVQRLLEHKP
jgi:Cu2+-exporting ATPase